MTDIRHLRTGPGGGTMHRVLDVLGLAPTDQALYESMVQSRPATFEELQAATCLEPVLLARALEQLETTGLITRNPGPPARYAAVAPDVALEALLAAKEEQLTRGRLAAEQLAARFRANSYQRDPVELIEVVTGAPAILARSRQMQHSARVQVRAVAGPPYLTPPGSINQTEREQLRRGVAYRVLYDPKGLADTLRHNLHADIELGITEGEQARVLPHPPLTFCLADDRLGWIPLQAAPDTLASALVIHPSSLLDALAELFEDLWAKALPLPLDGAGPPEAGGGPTAEERRLLALLASGVSDRAAARQLGVSVRTFHRRLHELTGRLGVETRFQAGVQAALAGWITRPPASDYSDQCAHSTTAGTAQRG